MCLHKYVLSGMIVLHTILCVDWLKNVNCAILRKIHWIVVTLLIFVMTKIGLAF